MKRFLGCALIVALFSVPALAAGKSQNVSFSTAVKVGSTQIPAGDYKLTWTGSGPNVQITIAKSGTPAVTVPARIVEQNHNSEAVVTDTAGGANVLESIELSHLTLVLENPPAQGQ
ncbi:MAG: hypothetical protein WBE76_07350 [Terracidiphilus sp.]